MSSSRRAFTLIELIIVVGIIGLLIAILIPYLSKTRTASKTLICLTHLRELGKGWQIYADENDGICLPGRMYEKDGGPSNPANYYDVGNGFKYRPRWPATTGAQISLFGFDRPISYEDYSTDPDLAAIVDRQDYDNEVFQCPQVPEWVDERNYAYGYNHQFLGNGRQTNGRFHNFPVRMSSISNFAGTVMVADSMGTAAGFSKFERTSYEPSGTDYSDYGNHGWSLDPPHLSSSSDRGTGDSGSPRTAVHPRHDGKVNAVFTDGHGETSTDRQLGYRTDENGMYLDGPDPDDPGGTPSPGEDEAHNRSFSGTGRDNLPLPRP